MGHQLRVRDAGRGLPGVVRRRQGRHPGAAAPHLPPRACQRPAGLSPLLRRRAAPALQGARGRGPAGRGGQCARGQPGARAELDPLARPARARGRGLLCAASGSAPARGDGALPGRGAPHGRRGGHAAPHRDGAPLRVGLRRGHGMRLGPAAHRHHSRSPAHSCRHERAHPACRRRADALPVARRLRARPGPGLGAAAHRHLRAPLRHRGEPRLVPEPRPHGGGPGAPSGGRPAPSGLLRRHRHPPRPAESQDLRPAGGRAHRGQLAQVPACGPRQVRGGRARGLPSPALAEGGAAARAPWTR